MRKIISILITANILFIQNFVFAIEENDISVMFNQQKLKSKLKKQYKGYEVIIVNNNENQVKILNANIQNGINGVSAFNTVEESPGGSVGTLWIFCGPLGLITFGITWLLGIIETPILYFAVKHSNKKAEDESILYENKFPAQTISKNGKITAYTLIHKKLEPAINILLEDEITLQKLNFTKN